VLKLVFECGSSGAKRAAWWLVPSLIGVWAVVAQSGAQAQSSAGILAASRSTSWSSAGVQGGIPSRTTRCGSVIAAYSGAATTINNAIAACGTNQYVELGAGTFTLSSGIVFSKSSVTLRGAGANLTKLVINGTTSGCGVFYNSAFRMCAGSGNIGTTAPDHSTTWTAGYAQGTSVITLGNTTGLTPGSTLYLDQLNDSSDGWPSAGDIYQCDGSAPCSNQGGNSFARPNRTTLQLTGVTAVNGNQVTISPPVFLPDFRASQSPGAWWGNSSSVLTSSGVEDLTIDFSGSGAVGIEMVNATNSWVRGVRLIFIGGPGSFVFHTLIINGFHDEVRDSYFYGPTTQGNTQYAYTPHVSGSLLLENNIFHHNVSAMIPNDPESGSVYAYNYVDDIYYSGAIQLHSTGSIMNLYEGNNIPSYLGDILHGTHYFETLFRNHIDGYAHNQPQVNENSGITLLTHNRFFNLIGNVIGHSHFTTYQANGVQTPDAIYSFGDQGTGSGGAVGDDSNVARTVMRWGNWDSVTSSSDSSSNDQTGTRFVASEVPSGIPNFANPVPSSQALPASLFRSSKPSYFGAVPWPAIGPDVAGSDITTATGGHANKIPARLCFENTGVDSAYGSRNIRAFNAGTCYGAPVSGGGGVQPAAPSNLRIISSF
jgi:hypothetical protein